jgi:nucleoside-diphosphate-sugar epimerase
MKLIIGAGLIGQELARQLVAAGEDVVVASRSATTVSGTKAIALDAKNPLEFAAASRNATTIFLCTNPQYHTWETEWPPVFEAAIRSSEENGSDLVVMGNLYSYGNPKAPMTEVSSETTLEAKGLVRKAGWNKIKAAANTGKFRAVEVRASDYFGPGAGSTAHLGKDFFVPISKSKPAMVVGDPNKKHSWSYIPDIAKTMIAASNYSGEWNRVWHVPSGEPKTRTEIIRELNEVHRSKGKLFTVPQWLLKTMGAFSPLYREVFASSYQFMNEFVIDSVETERLLGVSATPWKVALKETASSY